jgi:hypothetical protein
MSTEEREYWTKQVRAAQRTELENAQKVAGNWKTLVGALTGLFATAAFAGGKLTLDKLDDPWAWGLRVATVVALAAGALSTWWLAQASGLSLAVVENQSWIARRDASREKALAVQRLITQGKHAGLLAAAIVLLGSVLTLMVPAATAPAKKPPEVLVVTEAGLLCGTLGVTGPTVTVEGRAVASASSVTVVDSCG